MLKKMSKKVVALVVATMIAVPFIGVNAFAATDTKTVTLNATVNATITLTIANTVINFAGVNAATSVSGDKVVDCKVVSNMTYKLEFSAVDFASTGTPADKIVVANLQAKTGANAMASLTTTLATLTGTSNLPITAPTGDTTNIDLQVLPGTYPAHADYVSTLTVTATQF